MRKLKPIFPKKDEEVEVTWVLDGIDGDGKVKRTVKRKKKGATALFKVHSFGADDLSKDDYLEWIKNGKVVGVTKKKE